MQRSAGGNAVVEGNEKGASDIFVSSQKRMAQWMQREIG